MDLMVSIISTDISGAVEKLSGIGKEIYGVELQLKGGLGQAYLLSSTDSRISLGEKSLLGVSGYTSTDVDEIQKRLQLMFKQTVNEVSPKTSFGGIHTIQYVEENRIIAWPSMPACGALYYCSKNGEIIISNRPRIIAEFFGLGIDPKYIDYVITVGYPLDDCSPYLEIKTVCGGNALVVDNRQTRLVPYNLDGVGERNSDPRATEEADAILRQELVSACSVVSQFNNVEFRLSGGKDSRLLASALAFMGAKNIVAHTKGQADDARIAKSIAAYMDIDIRHAPDGIYDCDNFIEDSINALSLGDGLVDTEAHVIHTNIPKNLSHNQDGVMYGHSHLQKGGFAKTMRATTAKNAWEELKNSVVPAFVKENPYRHQLNTDIERVAGAFGKIVPIDLLYFPYAVLRAGRYLEPQYLRTSSKHTPIYPWNDERIYIASSNLNRNHRTREISMYNAMKSLFPGLEHFPLFNDKWRFQTASEKTPLFVRGARESIDYLSFDEFSVSSALKALNGSVIVERARELLDEEVLVKSRLISEGRASRSNRFNFQPRQQRKLIMRLYFLHLLWNNF